MTVTVYRNARVYSPADPFATALAVEDGQIIWVGSDEAAGSLAADLVLDVADGWIAPVFVDAHVHTTATGLSLLELDLSAVRSLAELLERVAAVAADRPGSLIRGGGWEETGWPERRAPTPAELDRAGHGAPVYLARVDLHAAAVSSALLVAAGVGPGVPLRGAAHHAVRRAALAAVDSAAAQRAALAHAAALGIGCVHEMAGPEISSAQDLTTLLAAPGPGPEVVAYWAELGGAGTARRLGAVGAGGDLFCDGTLGSHTAALREPYTDRPGQRGELRYAVGDIAEHVRDAERLGLTTGFHVIGDAAVAVVLAGYQQARGGGQLGPGHRLEHVEMADPLAIELMRQLGLSASVQPAFDARWGGTGGMYQERLGATRAAGLNPFAAFAAAGVPLSFGSDAPVTPLDPWGAVRAAVHPHEPGHRLTARAAFTAATRGGWRAVGRPGEGALLPGAPASFAIWQVPGELRVQAPDDRVGSWSTDPRAAVPGLPDLDGPDPVCLRTLVRGEVAYDSGAVGPPQPRHAAGEQKNRPN